MEFEELVRKRRMVRNFTSDPVPEASLERILDLARRGPSAGFSQGQEFIVVKDASRKKEIAAICQEEHYVKAGFDPFISGAPVLIIPCSNEGAYHRRYQESDKVNADGKEIEWPVPYWIMDAGAAVMLLLLAVIDEGLVAGFAGAKDLDALRDLLGIPAEVHPVGVIPIGYPAPDKRSGSLKRGRRVVEDVVHRETW